jgi:hypothetical protein
MDCFVVVLCCVVIIVVVWIDLNLKFWFYYDGDDDVLCYLDEIVP